MKIEDFTCEFERYPAYKDSGVDWLGEIPEGWEVKRIKYLFKEINERSENGNEELLSVSQYTGVTKKSNKVSEGELLTNAASLEGYKKVYKNDLVSNIMLAWNGSMGFSPYSGITSPAYSIYRLQGNNDERYFHYLLRTDMYKAEFKRNSSGVIESRLRLYTEDFFRIYSLVPSIQEQISISNFLDEKCNKIDKLIAQKEKMISLLEERKKILIQNAVTKGLNPDVKMKDSGVEWIGEIPEHWEVKKLKYIAKIFRGKFTHRPRNDEKLYGGSFPFFQTGDIVKADKYLINYRQTLNEKGLSCSTLIPKGTIVLSIAANIGDVAILGINACFPDSIVGFMPIENILSNYLFQILLIMKEQFISSTIKNTQMNLNINRIGNNMIVYAPKTEQENIIIYINQNSRKIVKYIDYYKLMIIKLKEYKSILINDVVTGKVKI